MTFIADIVISGNAVLIGEADTPEPAAILIKENKIAEVTAIEDCKKYTDEKTKIYHFEDQLIMPGFHDFHIHLLMGGLLNDSVRLHSARSAKEAAQMVKKYADAKPYEPFVIGCSWEQNQWEEGEPHRCYLDELIPDRPVLLYQAEFHSAWVNSKALELAGINRDTENPAYGEIVKDEHGEPTGLLLEHAVGLVTSVLPISLEIKEKLLDNFLKEAAKNGVTSVHDLLRIPDMSVEEAELYADYEEAGKLTTRVHFVAPLNGDLELAKSLRDKYKSNMVQFCGFKQFADGVTTSFTAYLLEPYSNNLSTKGGTVFPEETIKKWTVEADREGFRVRFHCIGDGAVHLALDAFEKAQQENGVRDSRHSIEHVEMIHPNDIDRFGQLGVLASVQPEHINVTTRDVYEELIGEERMKYNYLLKTMIDRGTTMVFGTDYPVVGLSPLPGIYRAVTRLDDEGVVWDGNERISLKDALYAYTAAPAYGSFREQELGTIKAGKLADIIVLDRNLFDVPYEEIKNTKVVFTMVDGKVVHEIVEEFSL
ncbi:amidohydrolase [Neobacillus massiliamazoniensis]|uniref:Amidohydrolase family protein n=1 Tax=Neobacillus massiliamazoniensis TaxID=1499688 RepID=A0A0U1NQD1_9BACI|nr:amidohydrolase [Neobacillus massiliamazoniensis]CRK80244.1 amidohydrolase family protein [Neobacillus massiliamazoniensis]